MIEWSDQRLTLSHHNSIQVGLISLAIIMVKSFLTHYQRCLDGVQEVDTIECICCKHLIDVVHCWNNLSKIWCTLTRKEECCIFEDLKVS